MGKPDMVELKLLKPFADLKAGDVAYFETSLADKLILDDAAEFIEDEFDRKIEEITAANPKAIANLNARIGSTLAARKPVHTLPLSSRSSKPAGDLTFRFANT